MRLPWMIGVMALGCAHAPAPVQPPSEPASAPAPVQPATDGDRPAPAETPVPFLKHIHPDMRVRILFAQGSATVPAGAANLVDDVVATLEHLPEVELMLIEGHRAADEAISLAQARADAVRQVLVRRGVAATRLSAVGVPSPCADLAGAQHRSVDFKALRRSDGATSEGPGCHQRPE